MLAAALLAAVGLLAQEPELRAWQALTARLEADVWKADPSAGYYLKGGYDWRRRAEACGTLACARQAYADGLGEIVELYYQGQPVPVRGATTFEASAGPGAWQNLLTLDVGEGWTFFWIDAGFTSGPRDLPQDRTGFATGLVRITEGRASWRDEDGNGVDLQRVRGAWRVTQVGECLCGHLVRLDGLYRPSHRRFNEHP
jgi:hypothetical protein